MIDIKVDEDRALHNSHLIDEEVAAMVGLGKQTLRDRTPNAISGTVSPPDRARRPALRDLDRMFHAGEARLTPGLSPVGLWLAYADWALNLANAPFRRTELAGLAIRQGQRVLEAATGRQVVDPLPTDHRFRDPAWQKPPYAFLH